MVEGLDECLSRSSVELDSVQRDWSRPGRQKYAAGTATLTVRSFDDFAMKDHLYTTRGAT